MKDNKFAYDSVPYPSFTFPQTRPDRLATLAAINGMTPALPDKCRVLELGCGDGANLLSFAYILPYSEFVGVDLSAVHIADGKASAEQLDLSNISLFHEDVMNFDRDRFGEFDFIIAHGLYSWVPDFVRTKVLKIYAECLAPQGVGYISYNTYPGCRPREIVWEMMKIHTCRIEDPMQKVRHGAGFVNFLAQEVEPDSSYQALLKTELGNFAARTPENIFHDDFAEINQPFYFHEFIEQIKPHGLQFLSEAFWMESDALSPEIERKLDELSDDLIRREQYVDFIMCRRFRSTLVCRENIMLNRTPTADILKEFYLASEVRPQSPNPNTADKTVETFLGPESGTIESDHPLTKAALIHLEKIWTHCVSFAELMDEARRLCDPNASVNDPVEVQKAASNLLHFFQGGYIYLYKYRPDFPLKAGEFPKVSAFARWQIRRNSEIVTSLSGMSLKPDSDFMRELMVLLDGTRDRVALAAEMATNINVDAEKIEQLKRELPEMIESELVEMARFGLLHQ